MGEIKNETKEQENSAVKLLDKEENQVSNLDQNSSKNIEKKEEKISVEQQENDTKNETKVEETETVQKETNKEQQKQEETKNKEEQVKEEKNDIPKPPMEINKTEEQTSKSKHTKTNILLIVIGVLVVIVALLSTIFAIINIGNNKIMKGVSIGSIDVSNLTKEEAKKALTEIYSAKLENEIYLTYEDFETAITYQALEVNYQIDSAIEKAYNIGRDGNVFKDNFDILKAWISGDNVEMNVSIDDDMISQIAQNINNSIKGTVTQPSYYIDGEKLIITSGKEGLKVDEQQLLEDIYNILKQDSDAQGKLTIPIITVQPDEIDIDKIHDEVYTEVQDAYYTTNPYTIYPEKNGVDFDIESARTAILEPKEEYEIALIITKPTKTVKDLGTEAFPDKLSTFSTNYLASNVNRTTNLRLAAEKINGTILMPNEEFSYNQTVGERTIQAGYKEAAIYSNGSVVNGLGGGICQISSTLYDAVVMANLNVTTRRNHQFVTSYVDAGKDATVVWGSQDFKFVNTRSYPIRIEATVSGGVATISIWGVKEEVEYDIKIETKRTATIAYTTQYIQDPSLPAGKEVVEQAGSNGRKVEAYKVVRLNGQVVSTTLLSKDTYNPMKRIVRVGTGTTGQ